jgi:hypothetical protein
MLRVLLGCHCSGVLKKEFVKLGHHVVSCDLKPCAYGWLHHQGDLLEILYSEQWDLGIFSPECRDLCFSGDRWFYEGKKDWKLREQAFSFFQKIYNAPIPKIAVENSHSIFLEREFRKPDQKLHPYHFGDPYKKLTCFWLKGLKPLVPDWNTISWQRYPECHLMPPGPERSAARAKNYPGISRAIALQWGGYG